VRELAVRYFSSGGNSARRSSLPLLFADLLCSLRANNSPAAAEACVRTIATYLRNILKVRTSSAGLRVVNLGAFLEDCVLSVSHFLSLFITRTH
jgi:hypothetical protein